MDSDFWIKAWIDGRTNFHQSTYNDKLLEFFPSLGARPGQKVFVPLCGKTKDMLWLRDQGLSVRGVELYEEAVKDFFRENQLPGPKIDNDGTYTHYSLKDLTVSCGDFFKLEESEAYDFVFDRAALVALPPEMRPGYARKIKQVMRKGGKCLLVSYEYEPGSIQGPPFSVFEEEIRRLYGDECSITLRQRHENHPRQTVFVLEKRT